MTLRRLYVLIKGLPPDALIWREVAQAREEQEQARLDSKLRERTSYYDQLREKQAREREAAHG